MAKRAKFVGEFHFEIRFKPNVLFYDNRGIWTDRLCRKLSLPSWDWRPDRLDATNRETNDRVFVTSRNAGGVYLNITSKAALQSNFIAFVNELFSFKGFTSGRYIFRVGIRAKIAIPSELSFEDLKNHLCRKMISTPDNLFETYGTKMDDLAITIEMSDSEVKYRLQAGAMELKQLDETMEFVLPENLPETSLYTDIDCFRTPEVTLSKSEMSSEIKKLCTAMWGKIDQTINLISSS